MTTSSANILGLSPSQLAQELTPQQFELLVRAYVQGHTKAELGDKMPSPIMLTFSRNYGGDTYSAQWRIGHGYSSDEPTTQGEILYLCLTEHRRRIGFDQQNKLMQIEHQPEPAPVEAPVPPEDEIQF